MLQNPRIVYLRYVLNSYSQLPANTRQDIEKPNAPNPYVSPYKGQFDPAFISAVKKYQVDYKAYLHNQSQPVQISNGVIATAEPISEQIKFIINDIDYNIDIGNSIYTGLAVSDFVNWYIKPITITMKGDSIISTNPLLASDNIIIDIYTKLQKELSEFSYNYFKKPRFRLYIDGELKGLNAFDGVIQSFTINESAGFPDKYGFTLRFVGKPSNNTQIENAITGHNQDNNLSANQTTDPVNSVNAQKLPQP
jgi:hypothetical protein